MQRPDLHEDQAPRLDCRPPRPLYTLLFSVCQPAQLQVEYTNEARPGCSEQLGTEPWATSLTVQTLSGSTSLRRLRSKLLGLPRIGVGGGEWEAAQAALGGSVQGAGCWGLGAGCLVQGARGFGAGCWWLSAECWGLSAGCWVTQCRVLGGSVQGAGGLGAECWWKGMSEEALRGAWHSQASTLHGKCAAAYLLPRADRLLEKPLFSGSHVPQGNCVPGLTPGCTNLCGF